MKKKPEVSVKLKGDPKGTKVSQHHYILNPLLDLILSNLTSFRSIHFDFI